MKKYTKYMISAPETENGSTWGLRPPGRRLVYLALAYGCVGLGAVGAVLPVMPTTPFLLVALWAAARSSPRLRFRLYRHPRYGPGLRAWHRQGAVPVRAKQAACLLMVASLLLLWLIGAAPFVLSMVGLFFVAVAGFILTRPTHLTPSAEPRPCNPNR
ncbi:YbaN family protein [Wenzhouxiangella sp. EGI_FJ10305]|uniref:YbaN family protein n=1 Tax=Wenzhouxiangella sp. EGI_FJ10305 TaxID=3243768 RepID=UPI0035DB6F73